MICQGASGNRAANSSVRNEGFSPASPSAVVEARTVSSTACAYSVPSGPVTVIGTISRSKAPLAAAAAARWWDCAAYASRLSRSNFHFAEISSAEMPWCTRPSG